MTTPIQHHTNARRRPGGRRGFTLVELVVSMTILVVLMTAMTSVLVVAGRAIPDPADPVQRKVAALDVVDQLGEELFYATAITEATATAVTFTVADRGHGAAGAETIRYAWSGTPGDPLTRQYNGGTVVTVCESVQSLQLSFSTGVGQLDGPPRVVLIVDNDVTPNAQDDARRQQIESWGFSVSLMAPTRSDVEFAAALDVADVMYWSEEQSSAPPAWVFDAPWGIVCEKRNSFGVLGISQFSNWVWLNSINILDNTHEITRPFGLGPLTIFSTDDYGIYAWGQVAPGGSVLATGNGYSMIATVDLGAALYGGKTAPARRVALPWGDRDFDFTHVTSDGLTIMRRAITWAAAPAVYAAVSVALEPAAASETIRTEVQFFNTPKVNGP